jgi:hypothetical protein
MTTCPHCSYEFDWLPPDVEVETTPCHDQECTKRLCPYCDRFICECCGLAFCMEHLAAELDPDCTCTPVDVDCDDARGCELHGTSHPHTLRFCRECNPDRPVDIPVDIPVEETMRPKYIVLIEAMLVRQAEQERQRPHGSLTPENDLRMEYCQNCGAVCAKDDPYPLPGNPADGQQAGELTWVANGWDYWACARCNRELREVDERAAAVPIPVMPELGLPAEMAEQVS